MSSAGAAVPLAPASRRWFPLESVRGVAALSVVAFHAYQNQMVDIVGGHDRLPLLTRLLATTSDLAVDLFFVLSAFVLFLPVARAGLAGEPPRSAMDMLLRRCARLIPLYYTVVFLVWGISNTRLPGNWHDLVLHLTFTQVHSETYIYWTDGPAWSLAVEFHFYVLMALAAVVIGRRCRRVATRRARLAALAIFPVALMVLGTAWMAYHSVVVHTSYTDWPVWFGPIAKGMAFGSGMMLALLTAAGVEFRSAWVRPTACTVAVVLISFSVVRRSDDVATEWLHYLDIAASLLMVGSLVLARRADPRWLLWQPLVFLGSISYGVYLLHEPLMRILRANGAVPARDGQLIDVWITATTVAAVSIAAAWVSSRIIERNGLRLLAQFDGRGGFREYYPHLVATGF